eukprot:sb/3465365/
MLSTLPVLILLLCMEPLAATDHEVSSGKFCRLDKDVTLHDLLKNRYRFVSNRYSDIKNSTLIVFSSGFAVEVLETRWPVNFKLSFAKDSTPFAKGTLEIFDNNTFRIGPNCSTGIEVFPVKLTPGVSYRWRVIKNYPLLLVEFAKGEESYNCGCHEHYKYYKIHWVEMYNDGQADKKDRYNGDQEGKPKKEEMDYWKEDMCDHKNENEEKGEAIQLEDPAYNSLLDQSEQHRGFDSGGVNHGLCSDPSDPISGCKVKELVDGHGNKFLQNVCCIDESTWFQCPFDDDKWYTVDEKEGQLSLKCSMEGNSTLLSYQTCGAIEGSYCGDPVCEKGNRIVEYGITECKDNIAGFTLSCEGDTTMTWTEADRVCSNCRDLANFCSPHTKGVFCNTIYVPPWKI